MRTLFLDIDGVLHPEHCHDSRHFCCLPVFEKVLHKVPDCEVVITSTWRLTVPFHGLRSRFSPNMAHRIVGTTGKFSSLADVPSSLLSYEREAECYAWLRRNDRAIFPWLALDDRAWLFRPFNRSLFLVDGKTGITTARADELIERLRNL
ncbi:HAD domain-containing protein [Acidovorax sp. FHTAMBA]|uniref:HAD domain-containing protein n=1 Tax=Acidovorax sp. FHTAMBA TaxID=3140252 RepID=UPI003183E30E